MFSNISWGQFISTIIFLSAIYYIAIILLYYRKDILNWSRHGIDLNKLSAQTAHASSAEQETKNTISSKEELRPMSYNEFTAGTEDKINYAEVHELMEDLKTIFINSAKNKIVKQELILAIRNKLHDYPQLKGTEIENEIIQHIKNECQEKCAFDLDKTELENLWKP